MQEIFLSWLASLPLRLGSQRCLVLSRSIQKTRVSGKTLKYNKKYEKYHFFLQGQKTIKTLVIFSGVGSLLWLIGLITWMTIFTTRRVEWGAVADYMSFNIPLGTP